MGADIAAAVATTKERLAQGGASARGADRPATATIEGGLACRVDGPDGWSVSTDMPAAVGGNADAPSPGWLLLAAWAACTATVIAMRAAELGISLDEIEVVAESESDLRGLLGVDDDVAPGPLAARLRIRIDGAGADPAELRELVDWADRHSVVADALRRAIPTTTELEEPRVEKPVA